jgi:hypothetical protein
VLLVFLSGNESEKTDDSQQRGVNASFMNDSIGISGIHWPHGDVIISGSFDLFHALLDIRALNKLGSNVGGYRGNYIETQEMINNKTRRIRRNSVRGIPVLDSSDSSAVKAGVTYDAMFHMMNMWNHPFYDGAVPWRRSDDDRNSVWPLVMTILPHQTNQSVVGGGDDGGDDTSLPKIEEID